MFFAFFLSFIFGLSAGSFLNCLLYRFAKRESPWAGFSYCPKCRHRLVFFDLIPLFSFLFLNGRCRYCQQKISLQYPLVELVTGFLFFYSFLILKSKFYFPASPAGGLDSKFLILLFRDWLFILALIFIFVYDLKYMLIEEKIVIPATIVIFLINLLTYNSITHNLFPLLLGAVVGFGFFALQYLITKGEGIGSGDLLIGLLLGVSLAWPKILIALIVAYLVGALVAAFLLLTGQKTLTSKIPLGPFLALGGLFALFFGEAMINLFLF